MKANMFPGQGSQRKGMGRDLFGRYPKEVKEADKILGYSIEELCLEDPRSELRLTQFTQVALYVVSALSYMKKLEQSGEKPDYLIGHSLGEYNALLAAECFDFETGLKLVKKRGELMALASEGGMAAILNAEKDDIIKILKENHLDNIDLANFNSPNQIIISGKKDEIGSASKYFQEGDMKYVPLNTSGAFHSRFMGPAREKFSAYIEGFKFADPVIPVISNVSARPYGNGNVIKYLSEQIVSPVRWTETIRYLLATGVVVFEELGEGQVLTKLVNSIRTYDEEVTSQEQISPDTSKTVSPHAKPDEFNNNIHHALAQPISLHDRIDEWNVSFPIGTVVKVDGYESVLKTSSKAIVLFGHRAAIYIEGYRGYFALDEVVPV